MSKETSFSLPNRRPSSAAASTPAAGPDSVVVCGCLIAVPTPTSPPADCMIYKLDGWERTLASSRSNLATYPWSTGAKYAATATVLALSNSLNSAAMPDEIETNPSTPALANSSSTICLALISWVGLAKENRKQMPTEFTPSAIKSLAKLRHCTSSRGTTTEPSFATRSSTSLLKYRGARGAARSTV